VGAQRHAGVGRGGEHGIPVATLVVDRGEAERARVLTERQRTGSERGGPLDLPGRLVRVPQWDDHQRDEASGGAAAPFVQHEVVVRLDARQPELLVLALVERLAAQSGERGEAQRREDAGAVHVLDSCRRVVAPAAHVGVRQRKGTELLARLAGGSSQAERRDALVLVVPRLAQLVLHEARACVAQPGGKPALPCVRWLDDVVIDGDHPVEIGRHRPSRHDERGVVGTILHSPSRARIEVSGQG
jgi:hypothetical protein